jgi:uncharacterized coiled-coil DUF342 family protein
MTHDLEEEVTRQGITESMYVRDHLARALGRAERRDEIAALKAEIAAVRTELSEVRAEVRLLRERFVRRPNQ